jgi:Na+/H+ antiporter NhaC
MPRRLIVAGVLALVVTTQALAQDLEITGPEVFLTNTAFSVTVSAPTSLESVPIVVRLADGTIVADTTVPAIGSVFLNRVTIANGDQMPLEVVVDGAVVGTLDAPVFPGIVSVLPPLLAIVLALVFREVVTSLFAGVWLGSMFLSGFNPIEAIFVTANRFGRGELADADHAAILLFTLMLGGMVGLVTKMGGIRAIVDAVSPLATNRRRGQIATWLAGLAIFFDDYANSLVVGNTMRPITDRLKISREKLAYIVDSTAAPVAAIFFISTWIGYQVSLIAGGLDFVVQQNSGNAALVAEVAAASPFGVFLQTIPYLFYPIFTIFLVGAIAITGRDFGPMLRAEQRAAGGQLHREGAQLAADISSELKEADNAPDGRWWNGALPVAVLVVTVLYGLVATGIDSLGSDDPRTLRNIFGGADPYSPLMWGSILASIVGVILAVSQKILTISEGVSAWLAGMRAMMLAVVILVMAWSLGSVTNTLGTANYLSGALSDALPPALLPTMVFIVAALMAFATGTSWATMAILLPLVVPLAIVMIGGFGEAAPDRAVVFGSIGSVLAGAIMGDHCSPISDTTVLSSTASSCDHVDHVRTQLPYAILAGGIAIVLGNLPTAFGVPVWVSLALGMGALILIVRILGRGVAETADR